MKTSALSAMQRSFKDPSVEATSPYHYDQQFSLLTEGKEQSARFFATLYAVLLHYRLGLQMRVFIAQGPLLYEHDGSKLVRADPVFLTVLTEFEAYLLAERQDGAKEMRLSMQREVDKEQAQGRPIIATGESTTDSEESLLEEAPDGTRDYRSNESPNRQNESGRRDHRRRR